MSSIELSRLIIGFMIFVRLLPAQNPSAQQDPKPVAPAEEKTEVTASSAGAAVVLLLRVWRESDLSGLITVRPDGKVNLLLVGEVDASGLTPVELEARITKAYEKVLKNPIVSLQVQKVESKRYFLSGEVGKAGAFPLVRPMTVLEAITLAGGLREFANGKKIVVMRGAERIKFNYNEVVKGKKLEQNIQLLPDDHIFVP
jgi:polysaccharide export outer membrane protein